jgi:GNAT superfamily N-acetyltransferase
VKSVVEQVVAIRRAVLGRRPELDIDSPAARQALASAVDAAFADLEEERVLPERAVVLLWRASNAIFEDVQRLSVDVAPGDHEALAWAAEQLVDLAPRYDPSLELMLDVAYEELLPAAEQAGLTPRMTYYHGPADRALEGLRQAGLPAASDLGDLRIGPMSTDHIDAANAIGQRVFTDEPQFSFIPPRMHVTPDVQERLNAFFRNILEECVRKGTARVVLRGDEVVGYGNCLTRHDPVAGHIGGFGITLSPEIRNRGIGKLLYAQLLERLLDLGVREVRGRTANPVVASLAQRMGRTVRGWQLELLPR